MRCNRLSLSDPNNNQNVNRLRNVELSRLKSKIIDAIRFSERYWLIYKENTFGIATIIDLMYKKSYIESLFFTKIDVAEKGVPLVKIYSPLGTQFNFNEVIINPELDEDGVVRPSKIIERLNILIDKEIKYHLNALNEEIRLIDKKFENYAIKDNPYFRKILIYFPNYSIELRINLENYPNIPSLSERKQLIIKKFKEPLKERIKDKITKKFNLVLFRRIGEEIKIYDDKEELTIDKLKEPLIEVIRKRLVDKFRKIFAKNLSDKEFDYKEKEQLIKEKDFGRIEVIKTWDVKKPPHIVDVIESILKIRENSQYITLNNISLNNNLANLNLKVHRGQSIGILYDLYTTHQSCDSETINNLFKAISGINTNYSGDISVFGNKIQTESIKEIEEAFIASDKIDSKMESMSVNKALVHNLYIMGKRKSKKKLLTNVLGATGLLNRKNIKISDLSILEKTLFSIARALIRMKNVIMASIPPAIIGKLEYDQFNSYVEKIKTEFHTIFIICGPQEIISECDKIITIKNKQAEIGTLKDYISKLPYAGEIITVELDSPDEQALKKMLEIDTALFIEERKNEKYKIFCIKENPNKIIVKLMELIGDSIYNIDVHKASLEEYLLFLQINQKNI